MDVNMNSTNLPMSETSHTLASLRKLALCDDKNQEVELSDEEKRQKSCWSSCLKEVEKRHVITFMDVQSICRMDTCMSGSSSWKEALSSTRSPALSKWTEYSNVDDFKGLRWCMSRNIFLDNVKLGKIVEDNVKGSLLPTQVVKQFGWLCQHQQSDVACLLLSAKSVDANRTLGGASLLHIASAEGLENVVGVLVAQGAKLGKVAKDGATPLVSAVQRQHYSVAHMLVMAGSDVNKADKTRRSPLHYAACAASPRIVAMLLLHGAEIDSMDNEGSTPIITACQYSTDTDVGSESVVQLVAAGSDVNRPRKDGYTALALACKAGSLGATTCLLEQGAEVHSTLPMYVASQEGHLKCVLALLHAGAPSDRALADTGATPLSAAAENGHADIVQALLHVGASVDKVNPVTAYAPMHLACLGGHVTVVEVLLDAGAHLNLRGGKHSTRGVTPLGCALSKKCNAVITLLRARGAYT